MIKLIPKHQTGKSIIRIKEANGDIVDVPIQSYSYPSGTSLGYILPEATVYPSELQQRQRSARQTYQNMQNLDQSFVNGMYTLVNSASLLNPYTSAGSGVIHAAMDPEYRQLGRDISTAVQQLNNQSNQNQQASLGGWIGGGIPLALLVGNQVWQNRGKIAKVLPKVLPKVGRVAAWTSPAWGAALGDYINTKYFNDSTPSIESTPTDVIAEPTDVTINQIIRQINGNSDQQ